MRGLLDRISEELAVQTRHPGDVTINEIAESTSRPERTVRRYMEQKVRSGELEKIQIVEDGHLVCVYRECVDSGN